MYCIIKIFVYEKQLIWPVAQKLCQRIFGFRESQLQHQREMKSFQWQHVNIEIRFFLHFFLSVPKSPQIVSCWLSARVCVCVNARKIVSRTKWCSHFHIWERHVGITHILILLYLGLSRSQQKTKLNDHLKQFNRTRKIERTPKCARVWKKDREEEKNDMREHKSCKLLFSLLFFLSLRLFVGGCVELCVRKV